MAKKARKTNTKQEVLNRKICVLIFPESREVYVDRTTAKSLWQYYDGHYRERNQITAPAFRNYKSQNLLPEFYLLQEVFGTDSQAFSYCIAWSKRFSESGYELLGSKMSNFIEEMDAEIESIYYSIQDISIQEICSKSKNLFPEFKQIGPTKRALHTQTDDKKHRISVSLTDCERQKIKKLAEKYGVTMSEYILECVRLGGVFQIDTLFLEKYINQADRLQQTLDGMLATYLLSGEYYPADMVRFEKLSDQICQSNTAVAKEFIRFTKELRALKKGHALTKDVLE